MRVSTLVIVILSAILFISAVNLMRGARVDLTEGDVYSLSDGTKSLLAAVDEDIKLTLYFSDEVSEGIPQLRSFAQHVGETLMEISERAGGKITVSRVDPAPFSEAEDAATAAGLSAVPANLAGDQIYLGLVGVNAEGRQEIIPFFQPEREQFLEYELAKLIHNLDREAAPKVGLVTDLPVDPRFDFQSGGQTGGWIAIQQLEQLFEVTRPNLTDATSLQGLDLVVLIHPKGLSQQALYNLDQFVLAGGQLLAFVDPFSDNDTQVMGGGMGMQMPNDDNASNLGPLLSAWGVHASTQVVGDPKYALTVSMGRNTQPTRHLGILAVDESGLSRQDVVTSQLQQINLSSAGAITKTEDATTELVPLISSSSEANFIEPDKLRFLSDPQVLQQGFELGENAQVMAAWVHGKSQSAFPEGVIPPEPEAASADAPAGDVMTTEPIPEEITAEMPVEIPESVEAIAEEPAGESAPGQPEAPTQANAKRQHINEGEISVILVADSDLLSDMLWVQVQDFFGQRVAQPWANNGDFLINAVDYLSGNTALVSVRGRTGFQRPFTRVEALRRSADERSLAQEQRLQTELSETEAKLVELERQRNDADGQTLTPEQTAELQRFQLQKLSIRKELRQVQRDLTLEIEQLGTVIKAINILAVPLLLTLLLWLGWLMKRRRDIAA